MAKNKYKLSQIHKIKVHHNRWLAWAIAYLLFVAVALVGYIKVSDVNFETDQIQAESAFYPWRGYTNHALGFSLRYPSDWSIEAESDASLSFVPTDLSKSGVNVAVFNTTEEKSLRKGLSIDSEKKITVDGVVGAEITNEPAQGSAETVVLVTNEKKLYVIRGERSAVMSFLQTFKFASTN
jgi:hypothetical protein